MVKEESKEPPIKKFKRYVAKPGPYGVVTIPSSFVPTEDMNPDDGTWVGVVEVEKS